MNAGQLKTLLKDIPDNTKLFDVGPDHDLYEVGLHLEDVEHNCHGYFEHYPGHEGKNKVLKGLVVR